MDISEILAPQAVFEGLKASNKKKLITEIAAHAAAVANLNVNTVFENWYALNDKSGTDGRGLVKKIQDLKAKM